MEAPVNSRKSSGFAAQDECNSVETGSNAAAGNTHAPPLKFPIVPKFPVVLISDKTHYIISIVSISQRLGGFSKLTSSNAWLHFCKMRPF